MPSKPSAALPTFHAQPLTILLVTFFVHQANAEDMRLLAVPVQTLFSAARQ